MFASVATLSSLDYSTRKQIFNNNVVYIATNNKNVSRETFLVPLYPDMYDFFTHGSLVLPNFQYMVFFGLGSLF